MAKRKRKMPARYKSGPKKGQFKPRGSSSRKRKNPTTKRARRTTARRKPATTTRRRRRRNPPKMKPMKSLTQGVKDAGAIVAGKAVARFVPAQFNLPRGGAVGLAVQAGVALLAGMAANKVGGKDFGRMVLAGGLTAPIETAAVAYRVPLLGDALSPVTAAAELGAYANRTRRRVGTGTYAQPPRARRAAGVGRYALNGYDAAMGTQQ